MNRMRVIFGTLAVSLACPPSAFAGTTARVYSSSTLVLAFVGFLALVVVIQLIPAIMTLFGALRGLAKKEDKVGLANDMACEKETSGSLSMEG